MKYYGNFAEWKGELSDYPAITISTDPEHMPEMVGYGFQLAAIITPNKTFSLKNIEKETDTEILAFNEEYKKLTGRNYFIQMSEETLCRKFMNVKRTTGESPYQELYDPLQERFSERVFDTIGKIIDEHGEVFLFPYMMNPYLNERRLEGMGCKIIAPRNNVVERFNNKTRVYEKLKKRGVSVIEGEVVDCVEEACELILEESWENGAFISAERGAGGSGVIHAYTPRDIRNRFPEEFSTRLLVTKWLDEIEASPNIFMFIDGEGPHILSITDQIIENETVYHGNVYPLKISEKTKEKIKEECLKTGELAYEEGYRGILGIDGIVSEHKFFVVEINPRKNHSSVLNTVMMEKVKYEETPPLVYIETLAILDEDIEYDIDRWAYKCESSPLSWDMYIFKKQGWSKLKRIPDGAGIRDHDWDFQTSYVANVPCEIDTIIPKTYASLKSDGHTRRTTPNELGRIVSPDSAERLKKISELKRCFEFYGDRYG